MAYNEHGVKFFIIWAREQRISLYAILHCCRCGALRDGSARVPRSTRGTDSLMRLAQRLGQTAARAKNADGKQFQKPGTFTNEVSFGRSGARLQIGSQAGQITQSNNMSMASTTTRESMEGRKGF